MELNDLPEHWDLIIIGGGITGAGIFREAVRMGLRVLLLEQHDFAWGTSSRSSKLIHGGLRYLKQGRFLLTRTSVRERQRLLHEAPGLVEPLPFLLPVYNDHPADKIMLETGLSIYDILAKEKQHDYFDRTEFSLMAPHVRKKGLKGGFRFLDAQVDDARLVLRLINEGLESGGVAKNYSKVSKILKNKRNEVTGVNVKDSESNEERIFSCWLVINATGSWAETFHPSPVKGLHLRPLRGSHLIFPAWAIPLPQAISFFHPADKRPLFVIPWEGAVFIGTTDVDFKEPLSFEPVITMEEVEYLMEGLTSLFPSLDITLDDCLSSYAGVRPVLSEGNLPPSEETREHVVWVQKGLITITGGKLTTFHRLAWDALKAALPYLPPGTETVKNEPVFQPAPVKKGLVSNLDANIIRRLYGRYGLKAEALIQNSDKRDLKIIPGTNTIWAELPYTAKNEHIRHLTDLLLRRTRIGLLLPGGGEAYLSHIQRICQPVLPWDNTKWEDEKNQYLEHWKLKHKVPVK